MARLLNNVQPCTPRHQSFEIRGYLPSPSCGRAHRILACPRHAYVPRSDRCSNHHRETQTHLSRRDTRGEIHAIPSQACQLNLRDTPTVLSSFLRSFHKQGENIFDNLILTAFHSVDADSIGIQFPRGLTRESV